MICATACARGGATTSHTLSKTDSSQPVTNKTVVLQCVFTKGRNPERRDSRKFEALLYYYQQNRHSALSPFKHQSLNLSQPAAEAVQRTRQLAKNHSNARLALMTQKHSFRSSVRPSVQALYMTNNCAVREWYPVNDVVESSSALRWKQA